MIQNLIVGLHTYCHDGNISVYDTKTCDFKYLKFERISGIKGQSHDNLTSWVDYLNYLGYDVGDVTNLFVVDGAGFARTSYFPYKHILVDFLDHHTCHHWSTLNYNSLIVDGVGSSFDCLSVFKKHHPKLKLNAYRHSGLGRDLDELWSTWFLTEEEGKKHHSNYLRFGENHTYAGHTMALHAFGQDYSQYIIPPKYKLGFVKNEPRYIPNTWENFEHFKNKLSFKEDLLIKNSFVTSLHYYWYKKIKNHLKNIFKKNDCFSISGGVGHNIILNTMLKKDFPNLIATPHCGDEGLSIGALIFGMSFENRFRLKYSLENITQHDENFGYASINTIKQVAKFLQEGKIIMWGQGWGEIGPRALGFRSILMDPCVPDAKQKINDRIKKRIWFRPYGASVPADSYQKYFDIDFESPWMLYQSMVKDTEKFKNITHADGTCRIQTVGNNNPTYLKLLKEFEKLSGYPVVINTSMNLPGKPIVGTKKQAKIMFENSQADILVIGDDIYTK